MMKFLYIFTCLSVVFNCATAVHLELVDDKIKITVGTTAGSTDTGRFINEQLIETYEAYNEHLLLEFVPWGATTFEEDGTMKCEFGSNDCFANRVHRCALNLLSGNQDAQLLYMSCEFTSPYPAFDGSYLCGRAVGVNLIDLDYCVSTTGHALDLAAQEAAREPMDVIQSVPTVHFNDDNIELTLHNQALQRLKSMVCFALAEHESTGVTNCLI